MRNAGLQRITDCQSASSNESCADGHIDSLTHCSAQRPARPGSCRWGSGW